MSAYHIDLGELEGHLIAVDGIPVQQVPGRIFPIAVAQRLDIVLAIPNTARRLSGARGARRRAQANRHRAPGRDGTSDRISGLADAASPPLTLEPRALAESRQAFGGPQGGPDACDQFDRGDARLPMVDQQCGLDQGCPSSCGCRGRKSGACAHQSNHDAASHASAWSFLSGCRDQRRRFAGAVRDTVLVPPKTTVTVAFDANNPGWWAFHCHLLYHQHAGMFTTLRYD